MELLLLSNSRNPDSSYLAHALEAIRSITGQRRLAAFLPFAAVSVEWDDYTAAVKTALDSLGLEILPLHRSADPVPFRSRSRIDHGRRRKYLSSC